MTIRETLEWYRRVVAAYAHGGGDGPHHDLVADHGTRAEEAIKELDRFEAALIIFMSGMKQ